ncbi:MAG TPA: DEAD/DEAH box helicase, partial [Longimicrobiales bacterium]|nr:DEAD/DEAH box helicase [Longimicrobiales bacterium]
MDSFEELGLGPELVEALAAEGIERPTPFQEAALPVIRRGNNLVGAAGPGAGTLVAYGAGLLDRMDPAGTGLRALVVVPFAAGARRLAVSLGRLATLTGHSVAALGSPWALPERADVLFATPADLLARIGRSDLELAELQALVLDGVSTLQSVAGPEALEAVLESVPSGAQRVFLSLPLTAGVEDLAERHARRAVHVPPRSVHGRPTDVPDRGQVGYRVVDELGDEAVLALVSELLDSGRARHLALFVRSEDRAADLGDHLTLHGYVAGAPGDPDVPVWLAVDELEALPALEAAEELEVVSVDVPAGPDALDRRHGGGRGGMVLVLARELSHLKDVAAR